MPSFQTLFRATVMVAVGVVVVKGWRFYGPSNEQMKAALAQAKELGQSVLERWKQQPLTAVQDPRAPSSPGVPPVAPPSTVPDSQPLALSTATPKLLPAPQVPTLLSTAPATPLPSSLPSAPDRMPKLMSRLQQLGAAETKLAPWGSDGQLYRFSCRAPLAGAPTMTRHFESVAPEPAQAVEQVVAKVEEWQIAQRDLASQRY